MYTPNVEQLSQKNLSMFITKRSTETTLSDAA